jgi:hypothetical protein
MHPAESMCFISVEEKPKRKARRKRKEKDEKKMTRVRRSFHHVKVTVTAWRVTSTCRKCLCQTVNKIGFFRAGEGPKYIHKENK